MSETEAGEPLSIRDELANLIPLGFREQDGVRNVAQAADRIMASPVIRRIQAEALRDAAEAFRGYRESGAPIGTPAERWLRARADRIEAVATS